MFIGTGGTKKSSNRYDGTSRRSNGHNKDATSSTSSTSKSSSSKPLSSSSPPSTISIRGIDVHFPFTPYDNQKAYMRTVMDALHHSENALLESPTGTGKTLCLLCSTLAWQLDQRNGNVNGNGNRNDNGNGNGNTLSGGVSAFVSSQTSSQEEHNGNATKKKVPTIIYASRTHSQLSQVVKEMRFTRYRPNHAVLGSREQMCIHPKINPTKSKAASKRNGNNSSSSSSNSRRNNNNYNNPDNGNNNITHDINHACTKLNKERKCRYRNNLEGFILSNEESASNSSNSKIIHSNGNDSNSNNNINTNNNNTQVQQMQMQIQQPVLDIEELVSLGQSRSICPFYFTKSQITTADIIFIPYNYLFDKETRKNSLSEVNFENAVIIFDEAHNLESFASESASFDLHSVDIAGCVLEVNRCIGYVQAVPDFAENSNTSGGSGSGSGSGSGGRLSMDNLLKLKSIFLQLEHYIDEVIPASGGSYSGEYIFQILDSGANLTFKNHIIFVNFLRTLSDFVMDMKGDVSGGGGGGGRAKSSSAPSSGTPKLDYFASCVKKVYGTPTESQSMAKARSYRVHISPKAASAKGSSSSSSGGGGGGFVVGGRGNTNGGQGRTLSYWCFAPALAMNELAALNVRSILVTSGTLSPLPSYSLELGLPFPHTIENEHIIGKDQISVCVIGKGVSGKALTSTYKRRSDIEYITELGNTIISLTRVIPGGVLIFFPSYGVMEMCVEKWGGPASSRSRNQSYTNTKSNFFQARKRSSSSSSVGAASTSGSGRYCFPHRVQSVGATNLTQWQRLLAIKSIILEPKTSSELKGVIDEFDKFISTPKSPGCIMIGVCRGKISEGIDFADEKCRAVIITGLPFAPAFDPKVKLKKEYLDKMRFAMTSKPSGEGGFDASFGPPQGDEKESSSNSSQRVITLSGDEWYSQQAHRAVNQAIGRVIRHRYDYGAILFLDSRFGEPRNQSGVSKWIRPCFEPDKGVGPAIGSLVQFYRGAKKKVDANKDANKGIQKKPSIKLMYEQESELSSKNEDTKHKDLGESVSKISFIKKSDEGNTSENAGYIRPEMITKQVELKDHISRKAMKMINDSTAEARIRRRLQLQKKNMNQQQQQSSSSSSSKPAVKEDQKKSAKLFFASAQDCLSPTDFQCMRKLLISMKSFGDVKDSKSYLKEARALIELLLKYDPCRFQSDVQMTNADLVELFLPLLPISYRYSIEKMGCKLRYKNSILKDECAKIFNSEELHIIDSKFPNLMINHDRDSTGGSGNKKRSDSHLGDLQFVLTSLMNNDKGSNIVRHVYHLIPKEYTNQVRKFVNNFQAKQRIATLKDKDKNRYGESGIQTALFQRPIEPHWSAGVAVGNNETTQEKERIEDVLEKRDALLLANSIKKERFNEQQKSWETSRAELLKENLKRKNDTTVATTATSISTTTTTKHGSTCTTKSSSSSKAQVRNTKKPKPSLFDAAEKTRASKRAKSIMGFSRSSSTNKKQKQKQLDGDSHTTTTTNNNNTPSYSSSLEVDQFQLDKCLEAAKADIYEKAAPRVMKVNMSTSRVKSNAPDGMNCVICNTPAKKMLVAECNHIACLDCWAQWLERSKTCPSCRKSTSSDKLAKAVFHKEAEPLPSLTQMCDSDDELEFVN